jgi:uncharacterized membrane protein required for colicin V production
VVLVITLSIINRAVIEKIRGFIPFSVNSGLGFLFGFFKGVLIIALLLACCNAVYVKSKPEILEKSMINGIVDKNDGILQMVIKNLLGNFISENAGVTVPEKTEEEEEKPIEEEKNKFLEEFSLEHNAIESIKKIDVFKNEKILERKVKENTELDKLINIFVE